MLQFTVVSREAEGPENRRLLDERTRGPEDQRTTEARKQTYKQQQIKQSSLTPALENAPLRTGTVMWNDPELHGHDLGVGLQGCGLKGFKSVRPQTINPDLKL